MLAHQSRRLVEPVCPCKASAWYKDKTW